ncbi:MAG: group II intron reverse transcriptase/maturase [Opitutales bacterium]|nr:group II intron reverse transcriptase/maturase [Opitutales bacterium]MCH8541814.1 group II intron reverse transcriptase/maturase [Opitutales bacterium]
MRNLYGLLTESNLRLCYEGLRKNAAPGVDRVTVREYGKNLDENLADLVKRLKQRRYRAKLVRRKHIPKGDGKTRPLGIPAVEDKLLQLCVTKILSAIYETEFLETSWGYRPGRGAQEASQVLAGRLAIGRYHWVLDADLKSYFDTIDHDWLIRMLELRVADGALLQLIRRWLKAGILEEDGNVIDPLTGTPQGGILSPLLANVYLHYALDLWFEKHVRCRLRGQAMLLRYADDFVCAFEHEAEARKFHEQLEARMKKFELSLSTEKTHLVGFSRNDPKGNNGGFDFLSFRYHWETTRKGNRKVQRMTSPRKRQRSEAAMRAWIKANRHEPVKVLLGRLKRKLTGYWNYYGVNGNMMSLNKFWRETQRSLYQWLNRRSQRRSYRWDKLLNLLKQHGLNGPRLRGNYQQRLWLPST